MFMGEWTDELGEKHRSGIADFLLMPRISRSTRVGDHDFLMLDAFPHTVPLWVEANRVRLDSIILWIAGKEVKTCNQAGLNGGELPSTIHYDSYGRKS